MTAILLTIAFIFGLFAIARIAMVLQGYEAKPGLPCLFIAVWIVIMWIVWGVR